MKKQLLNGLLIPGGRKLKNEDYEHAELFLTGDKDFLDSSVTDPRIISVAEFLSLNSK